MPVPAGAIGSGSSDVAVTQSIGGLSANTTYHFRVVATNANGTATSPDHTFIFLTETPTSACPNDALRTGPSKALPDCRAYEQVTPAAKNGATIGDVFNAEGTGISADGSRVITPSIQCFGGSEACTANRIIQGDPFAFLRTASGWVTNPLAPTATQFSGNTRWGFIADSGAALFSMPTPPSGSEDFYQRRPDGSFLDIGPAVPLTSAGPSPIGERRAATVDLSHLVYENDERGRWPYDLTNGESFTPYEYVGAGNHQPLLVAVSGGQGSHDLISQCGSHLGGAADRPSSNYFGPLSADGRTVFFSVSACSSGTGANAGLAVPAAALYARVEGEGPAAHTVAVSQRSPLDCSGTCLKSAARGAQFEGAARSGEQVLFSSTQQLTDSASEDTNAADNAADTSGCQQTICTVSVRTAIAVS